MFCSSSMMGVLGAGGLLACGACFPAPPKGLNPGAVISTDWDFFFNHDRLDTDIAAICDGILESPSREAVCPLDRTTATFHSALGTGTDHLLIQGLRGLAGRREGAAASGASPAAASAPLSVGPGGAGTALPRPRADCAQPDAAGSTPAAVAAAGAAERLQTCSVSGPARVEATKSHPRRGRRRRAAEPRPRAGGDHTGGPGKRGAKRC